MNFPEAEKTQERKQQEEKTGKLSGCQIMKNMQLNRVVAAFTISAVPRSQRS